jgi:nucleoside-triphosphatase
MNSDVVTAGCDALPVECARSFTTGPCTSVTIHALLLTGAPGVGKTTVVRSIVEQMPTAVRPAGFYTEEMRVGRERSGFRAITFTGEERILAHVDVRGPHRVSKYGVDVGAVDDLARTALALDERQKFYVIDEIGRMECLSPRFVEAVRRLLDSDCVLVATIGLRGGGFIAQVKARDDVELWQVTRANRDALADRAAKWVGDRLASSGRA